LPLFESTMMGRGVVREVTYDGEKRIGTGIWNAVRLWTGHLQAVDYEKGTG
jgi:hypothetical protein